jgi:hypothetical protein
MSRCANATRVIRYGAQFAGGLAIGLVLVSATEVRAQTADELVANPKKLEVIQQGCKTNQPWATDKICREAAEAIRRRFRGSGVRYTPPKPKPAPKAPVTPALKKP